MVWQQRFVHSPQTLPLQRIVFAFPARGHRQQLERQTLVAHHQVEADYLGGADQKPLEQQLQVSENYALPLPTYQHKTCPFERIKACGRAWPGTLGCGSQSIHGDCA